MNSNSVKSAKNTEEEKTVVAESGATETVKSTDKVSGVKDNKDSSEIVDTKEGKSSKKRKVNSRTPTPVSVAVSEVTGSIQTNPVVELAGSVTSTATVAATPVPVVIVEKKDIVNIDSGEKSKKVCILY